MSLSLVPQQRPEMRIHTVTIEEVLSMNLRFDAKEPLLEHYFSPARKEQFIKDYIHYLNSLLLEVRQGYLDKDRYLMFVLSFQFVAPLLEIPTEKELGIFYRVLEKKFDVDDLNLNIHFVTGGEFDDEKDMDKAGRVIREEEALRAFRNELDTNYNGRREVKESVQRRLKEDGLRAICKWQQTIGIPELAKAFGLCIVIPALFSHTDKRLIGFYRTTTEGISYEVMVPDFEDEDREEENPRQAAKDNG